MQDLALSAATHDLLLTESNDLLLISHAERVAQQIKITLSAILGEWFLDTRFGVPYFEYILVKNPNLNHARAILRSKILAVPGVKTVNGFSLSLDRQKRSLTVEYEATTIYGLLTRTAVLKYGQ